jgi:feruloyl-CoA synthase
MGTLLLCGETLEPHPATVPALLDDAARRAPQRAFLVERDASGAWETLTYARAAERSRRIGAALRALGASPERPVVIVGPNGIDHALVTFGAFRAGIPVVPVAHDAPLGAVAALVRPGVVFARDGACATAARAAAPGAAFVSVTPSAERRGADYAALLAHAPLVSEPPLEAATIAKVLLAWDADGEPRGIVTTHGMLCASAQAIAQARPSLSARPPVVVDGLPWSGAFGGNVVLGVVLRHAGTLYVDDGPAGTMRAQIAPTLAFDVPAGWTRWVERLRIDDGLRRAWLSQLECAVWEGAPLVPATYDALRAIGVPLVAAWGASEAGVIALTREDETAPDALGFPLAGVELKLVPHGDVYEARVRGPQVTPAYFWRPDRTAAAFDEDGFYRLGDLVRPRDPRAPRRGLAFVGRIDERFKLGSGSWVFAERLRAAFLAQSAPDVADAFVTGEGRELVGVLVWPSDEGSLLGDELLRAQIAAAMRRAASSLRRALIVRGAPPGSERVETAARFAAAIARLHASEPDAEVIVL